MGCLCSSPKETEFNYKGGRPLQKDSVLYMASKMTKTKMVGGLQHVIVPRIERKILTKADLERMRERAPDDFRTVLSEPLCIFSELKRYLFLTSIGGLYQENLLTHGITMIINATYEWPLLMTPTITSYRVPVDDGADNISIYFDEVADKIYECQKSNGRCVVHCMAGASRSTTLVLAYLMKYEKMPLKYAFNSVRKRRDAARPNIHFWEQLIDYELKIRKKQSVWLKEVTIEGFTCKYPDIYKEDPSHNKFYELVISKQLSTLKGKQKDPTMKTKSEKQWNDAALTYE